MGERTLRRLLIIGASSVVQKAIKHGTPSGSWIGRMLARKPRMLVIVALANKMARSDRRDLPSSARSSLKPPASRRRRKRRRVEGKVWRTVMRDGIGKPVFHTAPRARGCDLDPVRELPYRPAANERSQQRPNRCQHPTTRNTVPKIPLALTEASTDV